MDFLFLLNDLMKRCKKTLISIDFTWNTNLIGYFINLINIPSVHINKSNKRTEYKCEQNSENYNHQKDKPCITHFLFLSFDINIISNLVLIVNHEFFPFQKSYVLEVHKSDLHDKDS